MSFFMYFAKRKTAFFINLKLGIFFYKMRSKKKTVFFDLIYQIKDLIKESRRWALANFFL